MPAPGALFSNAKLAEAYMRILREAESAGGDREADAWAEVRTEIEALPDCWTVNRTAVSL